MTSTLVMVAGARPGSGNLTVWRGSGLLLVELQVRCGDRGRWDWITGRLQFTTVLALHAALRSEY